MGAFPSGQRGQTVNLLAMPSVVRIHPLPPNKRADLRVGFFVWRERATRGIPRGEKPLAASRQGFALPPNRRLRRHPLPPQEKPDAIASGFSCGGVCVRRTQHRFATKLQTSFVREADIKRGCDQSQTVLHLAVQTELRLRRKRIALRANMCYNHR